MWTLSSLRITSIESTTIAPLPPLSPAAVVSSKSSTRRMAAYK